ncbi:MAG: N-acetyltransferase [Candidatus Paceibacterota bacterium]|jgi:ribosomal protein S18 acetylase RimI-like enzyme
MKKKNLKPRNIKIKIRPPRLSDANSCAEMINSLVDEKAMISLQKKVTPKQELVYLKSLLKDIKDNKAISYAIDFNGKVMGMSGISSDNDNIGKHIGNIGIIVCLEARGMGLGEKLFQKVLIEGVKNLKFKIVKLDVFAKNKPAIGLYKKLGFQKIGLIKGGASYYGKYEDEFIMVKYIKN